MLFLQGFDQLRVEGLLCDVTLVPGDGDEVFPVHRAMMASASDYFKAMFTGGVFVGSTICCSPQIVPAMALRRVKGCVNRPRPADSSVWLGGTWASKLNLKVLFGFYLS